MRDTTAALAGIFTGNRPLSLILIVSVFVFGLLAFVLTPKQYNPEITLPAYRIVTEAPGASVEEVEALVTAEIERRLSEIPGIDELFSQSMPERSVVTALFAVGSNAEESAVRLQEKLSGNLDRAPLGIRPPLIRRIDPENVPILTFAITSADYPQAGLRRFAFDLRRELSGVAGVSAVEVLGGQPRELSILLDPERMEARSVTVDDVRDAVQAGTVRASAGRLDGDVLTVPVDVEGLLRNAENLGALIVNGIPPAVVRLQDVATIVDGAGTDEQHVRFATRDGEQDAVYLSVAKRKGENGVTVARAVHARLEELRASMVPAGIAIATVRDEGQTAAEEIGGLTTNLVTSILIVAVLLLLFLQWRAALTVSLAIPLTLFLVLIAGLVAGQTINRITLFALILSLGMLVDNAIVVVENVYRHLGDAPHDRNRATVNAVSEVGMGLLLSTLTSVIVFLPMRAVTGMMGAYMGPIAFFVPVALLASLLVAVTFSPYLSATILRIRKDTEPAFMRALDARYTAFIAVLLSDRPRQTRLLQWAAVGLFVALLLPLTGIVQFRMLPKADRAQFYVYVDAPGQTPLAATDAVARRLTEALLREDVVASVQTSVGAPPVMDFNGLFKGADQRMLPSQATLKVNLLPPDERWRSSERIVSDLRPLLHAAIAGSPDVRVTLVEDPPGPPVLATLLARVKGTDRELQEAIARDLLAAFRGTAGVVDVHSTLSTGGPRTLLTIDHEKLGQSGLSAVQVTNALRTAIGGQPLAQASLGEPEQSLITARFERPARDAPADLGRISLRNAAGDAVPLASIVTVTDTEAVHPVWRDERQRTTMVFGELDGRPVVYAVLDLIRLLLSYRLPDGRGQLVGISPFGMTYRDALTRETYRIEWGGEFEMTLENFRDLGIAMFIAFFLIYVLLVGQFRSFRIPLLIMTSIALGMGGVLYGFALLSLFGVYFSATSMIGAIALGGIVVNNAIILLEFIREKEAEGHDPVTATVEAAQTRLRPILLTTLTTVLGSLTIAGDPVWSRLAWAIVFGLNLSTVLTLVIFPVLYVRSRAAAPLQETA